MNYDTINLKELRKLPTYKLPPMYKLQRSSGNGCFMDPPGYPTYYTRSVYTQHGNTLPRSPEMVIVDPGDGALRVVAHANDWDGRRGWDGMHKVRQARLKKLYKPLPLDHPRTQAWISQTRGYFGNGYNDPRGLGRSGSDTVYENEPIIAATEKDVLEIAVAIGVPTDGVDADELRELVFSQLTPKWIAYVQEWYPEFEDDGEVVPGYGKGGPGGWWETEAERPNPENCKPRSVGKHPVNGSWCQWCGWVEEV